VALEKKFAILSFRDGVLGAAGAGGWTAPADVEAGGAGLVEAVVAGAPPPPPHPASNRNANAAAAGDPRRQPDPGNASFVPRVIAKFAIPDCYSKLMTGFPRRFTVWLRAKGHALP
jgi:hypothetical protein